MRVVRRFFPAGVVLVLLACNGGGSSGVSGGDSLATAKRTKDSSPKSTIQAAVKDAVLRTVFVERARLEEADKVIILTSRYLVPDTVVSERDSLHNGAYLVASYPAKNKADSARLVLEDDNLTECYNCSYILRDVTDSLEFKSLTVQAVIPVEKPSDDYYDNVFFGYKDGVWTELFSINDYNKGGIRFSRVDATNLIAFTDGQDEVFGYFERDYLFHVNTVTFQTWRTDPERQYIGMTTEVTAPFHAYRVVNGVVDTSLASVKVGMPVRIDTLYRDSGKVRLWLGDSTEEVEVKVETAKRKLLRPPAGG